MAPSDATEKNRNIGAQLRSIMYTIAQKRFWKFTSCMTFGAHKLVHFEPFPTTYTKFDNCCLCYIATCGKNFLYRCTSTFSVLKYCSRIFFQILQLSIRSRAHKLFRRFFDFSKFLTAISRNLWRYLAIKNENYVVHLKEQSLLKKG